MPEPNLGLYISDISEKNTSSLMTRLPRISPENQDRINFLFKHKLYDLPDDKRPPCHRDKKHAYPSMYGRLHAEKPAQTVTGGFGSMGQGRYVHPTEPRMISAREAARIQGIPDFFDFSPVDTLSELRTMIANAVPPQFMAALVSKLVQDKIL